MDDFSVFLMVLPRLPMLLIFGVALYFAIERRQQLRSAYVPLLAGVVLQGSMVLLGIGVTFWQMRLIQSGELNQSMPMYTLLWTLFSILSGIGLTLTLVAAFVGREAR